MTRYQRLDIEQINHVGIFKMEIEAIEMSSSSHCIILEYGKMLVKISKPYGGRCKINVQTDS